MAEEEVKTNIEAPEVVEATEEVKEDEEVKS